MRERPARLAVGIMEGSGEPRESVASGKWIVVASLSRGPGVLRRRSCPPSGMARLRCASSSHEPCPKTAWQRFRGHAWQCLHGGPKPTPRPGEGGSLARRGTSRPRCSTPLSRLPYVSAGHESASSRPHRHATRSVRRWKDIQDSAGLASGENGGAKNAVGWGSRPFFWQAHPAPRRRRRGRKEEGKRGMRACRHPPASRHFFFVALSLFFTCDPRVGGAFSATLSFLGLRVSLLLRTCPFAIAVTPLRCWETITASSSGESKAYFGRRCSCPAFPARGPGSDPMAAFAIGETPLT